MPRNTLSRRQMLRSGSVALGLPLLEWTANPASARSDADNTTSPKRFLGVCNNLGFLPSHFFPEKAGRDFPLTPYLSALSELRGDWTVFSGLSHPGVDGSHASDVSFLTAAPHPGSGGFRNTVSLDQTIAMHLGNQTRFPSLTLGVNAKPGRRSLSWTDGGILIPCQDSASAVFKRLFLQGTHHEVERQVNRLKMGQSIMDCLAEQARTLNRRLGARDRERIDQYTTAVRDVEKRLHEAQQWERKPKPKPDSQMPEDPDSPSEYMTKTRLMYQMSRLAFETDSTRAITLLLDSNNSPTIQIEGADISEGYHNLSHHGHNDAKLKQLEAIDRSHMQLLAELLGDLKAVTDADGTLLDHTMVLFGSNFGDASKHTTDNMPILLAGGGFRHGQHLAFDRDNNYPLPNLFVSILQRMGLEVDKFASSTGSMRGLDL